jgi:transposase InsO family protein
MGEITPAVANLLERDFHADAPGVKLLTDITEFSLMDGKLYLSPIVDRHDGKILTYTTGTHPDGALVNRMLDQLEPLVDGLRPVIHSDRGCHYRWPGWIRRMEQRSWARSMSKKGCSPDNSACEGFFGRLKNEMYYNHDWSRATTDEFRHALDRYIHWYNEHRIKQSLGFRSPNQHRRSLGMMA